MVMFSLLTLAASAAYDAAFIPGHGHALSEPSSHHRAIAAEVSSPSLLWHQHEDHAIFTEAFATLTAGDAPAFVTSSWLNPREGITAFGSGGLRWTWNLSASSAPSARWGVAAARKVDAEAIGPVDIVGAWSSGGACGMAGLSSAASNVAAWLYTLQDCVADLGAPGLSVVAMSDDASTVILGVTNSNHTASSLHALDGQSGKLLWRYQFAAPAARTHVDLSRDGAHILFVNGAQLVVLERATGRPRAPAFDMGFAVSADLCPMGVFIAYGLTDARILRWNHTANAYTLHHTFAPPAAAASGQRPWGD